MTKPERNSVVTGVVDLHLAEHLGDDELDVLVVDTHTLRTVDGLDLAQEVLVQRVHARDPQDVVRHRRAIDQGLARADDVAAVNTEVLRVRHEVRASRGRPRP